MTAEVLWGQAGASSYFQRSWRQKRVKEELSKWGCNNAHALLRSQEQMSPSALLRVPKRRPCPLPPLPHPPMSSPVVPYLHCKRRVPKLRAVVPLHLEAVLRHPQVVGYTRQVPAQDTHEGRGGDLLQR